MLVVRLRVVRSRLMKSPCVLAPLPSPAGVIFDPKLIGVDDQTMRALGLIIVSLEGDLILAVRLGAGHG